MRRLWSGNGEGSWNCRWNSLTVALFAHGYASIIANNGLEYDEKLVAAHLERAWNGAFLAATQEENEHEETV